MKNSKFKKIALFSCSNLICLLCLISINAQEKPPAPSAPKSVIVPAVKENKLKNGLKVAVVERANVPIVTAQLLIKGGGTSWDGYNKEGLANMTADLLTKGTKTRTATQIAEQMEFLGGSISTGAGWNTSVVTVTVMSDKLDQAMNIMSDVVLNPTFKQSEIDLLRTQTLDGLTYNLKQPGYLANYAASVYSFGEHPADGTPESLKSISRKDLLDFKQKFYDPSGSVMIFTGDISTAKASLLANKFFGKWQSSKQNYAQTMTKSPQIGGKENKSTAKRILVVDLPDSGQAAVTYAKFVGNGRTTETGGHINRNYYPALVLNSVLGGGYSSRLNQEIRIKRGLSYGAGSGFGWRFDKSNFATRTQTKNESAAEVAELVLDEVEKLADKSVAGSELVPRKSVLTGNFGRNLETTEGLAAAVADLYSFGLPTGELNSYTQNVTNINDAQIRDFAKNNLLGGDIIIVGDYAKFKDDLAKRFPKVKTKVIKADGIDLKTIDLN